MAQSLIAVLAYAVIAAAIYALVAFGYALIYSVLGFINFAHGELLAVGAYLCGWLGSSAIGLPLPIAALLAALLTATGSVLIGCGLLVPARRHGPMTALLVAIAVAMILQNLIALAFGTEAMGFYPGGPWQARIVSLLPVKCLHMITIAISIIGLAAVWSVLLKRTATGLVIRACAADLDAARTLGLRPMRAFLVVFALSGFFAALAGVAKALDDQIIVTTFGFGLGIRAFIASVIGGMHSLRGAVAGAVVLGFTEQIGMFALLNVPLLEPLAPLVTKDVLALGLLVLVLIIRPRGLFAAKAEARP